MGGNNKNKWEFSSVYLFVYLFLCIVPTSFSIIYPSLFFKLWELPFTKWWLLLWEFWGDSNFYKYTHIWMRMQVHAVKNSLVISCPFITIRVAASLEVAPNNSCLLIVTPLHRLCGHNSAEFRSIYEWNVPCLKTGENAMKATKYKVFPFLPWSPPLSTCHGIFYLLLNVNHTILCVYKYL